MFSLLHLRSTKHSCTLVSLCNRYNVSFYCSPLWWNKILDKTSLAATRHFSIRVKVTVKSASILHGPDNVQLNLYYNDRYKAKLIKPRVFDSGLCQIETRVNFFVEYCLSKHCCCVNICSNVGSLSYCIWNSNSMVISQCMEDSRGGIKSTSCHVYMTMCSLIFSANCAGGLWF